MSSRLQERLEQPNVSRVLRRSTKDLQDYRERVEQYARNFNEAVGLVSDLGIENVGVLAKLEQNSVKLRDSFQLVDALDLMVFLSRDAILGEGVFVNSPRVQNAVDV